MKIIFDLVNTGLGNQGGSSTLVKSGNTLAELGHEVFFIDSMKNQHTWTPLKVEHIIVKREKDIPNADFIISSGFKSVSHVLELPIEKGIKISWIRGWENWIYPEQQILHKILKTPTIKVVNSICLKNKLQSYGIQSKIIRPGNDFDLYKPMNIRNQKDIIIGGLYHTKHKTKRSEWIIKIVEILKTKYENLKLYMFGTNSNINNQYVDKYFSNPSIEEKNKMFNEIDIFLSPSYLEGLHIVPQEAMLTECCVITTDAEMSGTQDYIINDITGFISKNDFSSFILKIDNIIGDIIKRKEVGNNAKNIIRKLGDRKTNMDEFVKYLQYCKEYME